MWFPSDLGVTGTPEGGSERVKNTQGEGEQMEISGVQSSSLGQ